jgi:uncharacterized protein YkwD
MIGRLIRSMGFATVLFAATLSAAGCGATESRPAAFETSDEVETAGRPESTERATSSSPAAGGGPAASPTAAAAAQDPACGHRGDAEPSELAGITAAHNIIRCQLSSPSGRRPAPLSWSRPLAKAAQTYAERLARAGCKLEHARTDDGENLYGGTGAGSAAEVVAMWAAEQRCFEYGPVPRSCTCTCGHYTQLVWADTERLGCGRASCSDGSEIWVCRYDPSGNYAGSAPY